jgi:hypothetical protein
LFEITSKLLLEFARFGGFHEQGIKLFLTKYRDFLRESVMNNNIPFRYTFLSYCWWWQDNIGKVFPP